MLPPGSARLQPARLWTTMDFGGRRWEGALRFQAAVFLLLASSAFAAPDGPRHLAGIPGAASVTVKSSFDGYNSVVARPRTGGEPAYDYSAHLAYDSAARVHRAFVGGRWLEPGKGPAWDGDHVLSYVSPTGAPGSWVNVYTPARPAFPKGEETGAAGTWYSRNYMDPEAVKVGSTWYLYSQVMILPGDTADAPGVVATTQADRIQLHTSGDGLAWKRHSEARGVIVNIPKPAATMFHHEEVIFAPWDSTARRWWMYVAIDVDGAFTGYWRLRSADPTTFDFASKESANLSQLGNQIGYARDVPGGPVLVRITFADDGMGRTAPSLQFSHDGLAWTHGDEGPLLLHDSTDNGKNRNCYFLGMETIDGTGELRKTDASGLRYEAPFAATTSNTPGAPEIFDAEIGGGKLALEFEAKVQGAGRE